MKKRERRSFSETMRGIFNIRMWMGADGVKSYWAYIVALFKELFIPSSKKNSENAESFGEVQEKLEISDEGLNSRAKSLHRLSVLLATIGTLLFFYTIFQLFFGKFSGFLLTLSLTGLSWALAFRYHFWFFQIRERKLGCSLREWYQFGLKGGKR